MGPYPHDAPPATISAANPAGIDGFAFVEFAHPDAERLTELFTTMGCTAVAKHVRVAW
jgi:4-hydroxyphenylpyruvate dioxygenase